MNFYVYIHRRKDSGEVFYVGKGSGKRAWKKSTRGEWWKRIEAKHGRTVEIIRRGLSELQAFELEQKTIEFYGRENLCNLTAGGEGGICPSDETRIKMSIARKGRAVSEETKEKMRVASTGRHHSEETKRKLRQANLGKTGRKMSEDAKRKISDAKRGKPMSEETKQKLSAAKKGKPGYKRTDDQKEFLRQRMSGTTLTPEAKAKISLANTGRKHTEQERKKMRDARKRNIEKTAVAVLCGNGMFFGSITGAVSWLKDCGHNKASGGNISSCCRGYLKTAYGFTWKYKR